MAEAQTQRNQHVVIPRGREPTPGFLSVCVQNKKPKQREEISSKERSWSNPEKEACVRGRSVFCSAGPPGPLRDVIGARTSASSRSYSCSRRLRATKQKHKTAVKNTNWALKSVQRAVNGSGGCGAGFNGLKCNRTYFSSELTKHAETWSRPSCSDPDRLSSPLHSVMLFIKTRVSSRQLARRAWQLTGEQILIFIYLFILFLLEPKSSWIWAETAFPFCSVETHMGSLPQNKCDAV